MTIPAACAVAIALIATPSSAPQSLDLSKSPEPPALPNENAAAAIAAALEREIDALRRRQSTDDDAARAVDASIAFRMVARELLVRADAESPRRHDVAVAGFRVADARGDFDGAVVRALSRGPDSARARSSLERFRDSAFASIRAASGDRILDATRSSLAGLAPVLESAGLPPISNHWPVLPESRTGAGIAAGAPGAPPPPPPSWSEQVRLLAGDPALEPDVAALLRALADRIRDAESWPDLEPEIAPIVAPLHALPSGAKTFADATWLGKPLREAIAARRRDAVARLADAPTRAQALLELDHLARLARAVDAGTALVRPKSQTTLRGPVEPARLARTLAALALPSADPAAVRRAADRLAMVAELLETMVEVRRREEVEVRRDLRTLRRTLARDALKAEDPVLRQVETLAAPEASPADPACTSLLESQRRRIRALDALDGVDRALTEIEGWAGPRGAVVATRLRTLLQQLTDPAKAERALLRAETFLRQWRALRDAPAERAIRAGDSNALDAAAGRAPELLAELDRRRAAWAAGWAADSPDAAWASASELLMLLELIEDSVALARTKANPRLIGRWAGWDDLGGVPGSTNAMDGRIAVAIEAIVRQDEHALGDALRLLESEAPLWRLRARLLRRLATALEPLPDGLSGALGRAGSRPDPDAFLARRADRLAALGRHAREYVAAQAAREEALVEALDAWLRATATDLIRELDAEASPAAPATAPASP